MRLTLRAVSCVIALIGVSMLLGATLLGTARGDLKPPSSTEVSHSGCVIRFDQRTEDGLTAPRIYHNSVHYCLGVESVRADYPSGDLVIEQSSSGPIISVMVSPDETLAKRGISCGASGGVSVTVVRCYNRLGVKVDAYGPEIYGQYSNLWIAWSKWTG